MLAATGSGLYDVAASDAGFVAIGESSIWSSVDSAVWERTLQQEDTAMLAVTAGDTGYLSVGVCGLDWCDHATVWRSANGVTWEEIDAPLEETEYTYFKDVIKVEGGYLAGGQSPENASAAVWWSPDGSTWSRRWRQAGMNSTISGLAATPHGYVAAGHINHVAGRDEGWYAAIWMSPDGSNWSLVSDYTDAFGKLLDPDNVEDWEYWEAHQAVAGEYGTVVCGGGLDGQRRLHTASIWISTDGGNTWSRVDRETAPFDESMIVDIAETPWGLLAIGGTRDGRAAMWVSQDARVWDKVTLDDEVFGRGSLWDIEVGKDTVVIVGDHSGSSAVWAINTSAPAP
jgi:hypothetical protein